MKLFKRLLIVLLILGLLAVLGAGLFLDSILRRAIEAGGTSATGVATTLEGVDASFFSGAFGLKGLRLANPPGFQSAPFLAFQDAHARWQNGTILSDPLVVDEFVLDGLELNLERNGSGSNWDRILEQAGKGSAGTPAPPPGEKGPGHNVAFTRIELKNVAASLRVSGLPAISGEWHVKVPAILIENLRTNGSTTEIAATLTRAVVEAVVREASASGKGVFPAEVLSDLKSGLKEIGQSLRNEVENALQGKGGDLGGSLKEAEKGVKDLLGGKKKKP